MSMREVKVAEAAGKVLDWLVHSVECGDDESLLNPQPGIQIIIPPFSSSWEHGGPLLDKYNILFEIKAFALPPHRRVFAYRAGQAHAAMPGRDRLEAACRAIVAIYIGETACVPAELIDDRL